MTYENENSGRSKVGICLTLFFLFFEKFNYFFTIKPPERATRWSYNVIQYTHTQERNSSMVVRKTDMKRGIN